jgi:hypothetical protein
MKRLFPKENCFFRNEGPVRLMVSVAAADADLL